MAKKSYKLNNVNKFNNKSELQSKADSIVLTNYKKIEDIPQIHENVEEQQKLVTNVSNDLHAKALQEKLEKENKWIAQMHNELISEIENSIFKLENKELSKNNFFSNSSKVAYYDSYVKELQEKLETVNKDLKHSLERFEKEQQNLAEMYKKMEKLQDNDRQNLENDNKDYTIFLVDSYKTGSSDSSRHFIYDSLEYDNFEYDSLDEKWSGEELEI